MAVHKNTFPHSHILITGVNGFVGLHLRRHFMEQGREVFGFDLHGVEHPAFFKGSLSDRRDLNHALNRAQPEYIHHLAGVIKSVDINAFYQIHVLGSVALLDAVIESGLRPRIVIASSSAVYGAGRGLKPITESFQPHPLTHYAASKLAQEMVAFRYFTAHDLPVICVRTFNLLGPGLSPEMAPSAFAKQIAEAEKTGKPAKIFTGDLSARRDYVDVRDAVRAYALIAKHGVPGQVYNVCSGQAFPMSEILRILVEQARVPIEVALDPARVQKQDVPVQMGSAEKIQQLTGWKPEINIRQSLTDLLNDWREKINLEKT